MLPSRTLIDPDTLAHLAAIVGSSDDAIISKDLEGIIRSFNRAAERMFGYSASEVIGRPIQTLIPEERLEEEDVILTKLRRGERIHHFETKRRRKDGTLVDVSLTISPVLDEAGKVVGASKIARDITGRRRRALVEAQLAAIVESSDDAIISKDLSGIIQSFNRAAELMFGYGADEAIGSSIKILLPPDRHQEEDEILARLRRGEKIDHYETRRRHKDGHLVDVSLTVSPIRDSAGRIVGASKVARDVTEAKRSAALLAAQQEWFRVTLNSIGDSVIACDTAGRVTFMNHEAERATGWPAHEAVGRPLAEVFFIINEMTRQRVEAPADVVLRLGHVVGLANHTLLVARDGVERPIADSAAPIVGTDGRVLGVVLVFRDVSDSRRLEDQARMAGIERERLLENERAARNEAERANRVKDDFVAMVSHELRTPLNAILGWTDLLGRNAQDREMLDRGLEVIARNTRLQAKLIADLLDISRIVSGKLQLELDRVDLVDIVRASLSALKSDFESKDLRLRKHLPSTAVWVIGDAARLQQIFLNLLSNAVKFTPPSGAIDVRLGEVGQNVVVSVTDTGVGIAPEVLPDLFERFRQASGMTTRRYGGLGLGLSITKHLAELHGGRVSAWSAGEGQGATFTLEIPLMMAPRAGARPTQRGQEQPATTLTPAPALRNLSVLVVEDDHDTRDLVHRLLESYGATVTVAASAPEALDLLEQVRPKVIVSDIGLPDVDGYELIRRVRSRSDAFARVPAIALTAFARSEDRTRALRAGFNAHVSKPIEAGELAATIASLSLLSAD